MKNIFKSGILVAMAALLFVSCDPQEFDKPGAGLNNPPTAEEMSFTITPGEDEFHFVMKNNTPVSGIHTIKWVFGNGASAEGSEVIAYYPLPGTFDVNLTISTNNGATEKADQVVQTETDYAFLDSPILTALSGGAAATDGKTWVVDSLATGHFGIGPAGGNWPEWWAATALQKTTSGAYDDEFTFTLVGFGFDFETHGDTYVKDYQKDDANYSNPVEVDGTDCRVNYTSADDATWAMVDRDGVNYIVLSSAKPSFFGFDYGAANNEFRVEEITETNLHLSCIGGDGNRWYNRLVLKGYEKPVVSFVSTIAETAEENQWSVNLSEVVIPEGISVNGFTVDFGDGSEVYATDDYTATLKHVYMRKGNYPVTVTVKASNEDVVDNQSITVENYHSTYVPFLLDYMVMFVDNSEVEMAPMAGEDCAVTVVENPERIYPNKGVNVFHYAKDGQQWANANMKLPAGYRFNLTQTSVFRIMVRGKAGQVVLLKLENTDKGGNAWQTGAELNYTIQADDTWEVAEYNFAGVGAGWDWTGDQYTSDITTDERFNSGFYNIVRIMLNPGNGDGAHEFYFDDLAGPHVEGLKSARQ